ncbi:MAG: hypothetical protein ABJO12_01295 [Flavobacteriaceae bacterium]
MNQYNLILLLPVLGLISWIASLYLVRRWEHFWFYFGINFIVLIAYSVYILNADLSFLGHDEYGLGRLSMLITLPICHAILGFVIAIVVNRKINMRKTNQSKVQ